MDKIIRDVYVCRDSVKYPVSYPQGGDAVPIDFRLQDYDLPRGAEVRVYVKKPSGKAVYNTLPAGKVSGNTITVDIEKQMTAEAGETELQLEVSQGGKTLLTFLYPLKIRRSLIPVDSSNGSNFVEEYLRRVQEAIDEMQEIGEQLLEAAERGDFTASIQVGDTATLEAGKPAIVANVGTAMDAVLNFGIPKGKTGATGPAGPQGVQGPRGEPGTDGTDGTAVVTALEKGLFAVYISEEGHLMLVWDEAEDPPPLKIVGDSLKYIIGGVEA